MKDQLAMDLFSLWKKAPALQIALLLCLGASLIYISIYAWAFLCIAIIYLSSLSFSVLRQLLYSICLIAFGALYAYSFLPKIPSHPVSGQALIQILDKREVTYFGKTSLLYKISLVAMETEGGASYTNIPCYLSYKKDLPATHLYYVDPVTLSPTMQGGLRCKISKEALCIPSSKSSPLTEWRYKQKQKALQHLRNYIQEDKVYKLLAALTVGYLDHKALRYEFSKTGLQHLLTISGFHFALLATFCLFFLTFFIPKRPRAAVLILILGAYVLYLGPAPSVSRAWIAIFIYLVGEMFEIPTQGLNSLGIAASATFLSNPLEITQLGFQLSYVATLGILTFYTRYERWLRVIIPQRDLPYLLAMPKMQQLLYYFLVLIRKGLALDLAVNSLTLAILLCYFGSFPVMSIFYNLLIPPLFTITLFLLLVGFSLTWCPLLCSWIHTLNEHFTSILLSVIATIPSRLHLTLYTPKPSCTMTLFLLWGIFLLLLYGSSRQGASYGIFKLSADEAHKA